MLFDKEEVGEVCVYKLRVDYVEVNNAYCRISESLHCLGCVWVLYNAVVCLACIILCMYTVARC